MTTLPLDVELEYEDAKGKPTRRFVTINSVSHSGGKTYLNTWDHGRDDLRTFRADRVVCFITGDGEVVEPGVMLPQLQAKAAPRAAGERRFGWDAAFWTLVAGVVAIAAAMGFTTGDAGLAVFALVLFATPLFLLRWIVRAVIRLIGARRSD